MFLHVSTRWRLTFFLRFQSHPAADFESSNYVIMWLKHRYNAIQIVSTCDLPVGCGFLRVVHEGPGRHSFVMWNAQGRERGERRSMHCDLEIWFAWPSQWFSVEGEFCCYRMPPPALWCWSLEVSVIVVIGWSGLALALSPGQRNWVGRWIVFQWPELILGRWNHL